MPSSMLPGLKLQRLLIEQGGIEADENQNPSPHPQSSFSSIIPSTVRSSSDWTPLSSRTNSVHNQIISYDSKLSSTEDRLDRLLAEMEPDNPTSSPSSIVKNPNQHHHPSPNSSPAAHHQKLECWELSSLETRFQPVHHTSSSIQSSPLRPCLKARSTSLSSSNRSSISSRQSIDPMPKDSTQADLDFIPSSDHPHHLDLDQDRSSKVRFDDDQIEEILTWSRESYDRKGPLPITKLNVREIIELRSIKEELGISPSIPIKLTATCTRPPSPTSATMC